MKCIILLFFNILRFTSIGIVQTTMVRPTLYLFTFSSYMQKTKQVYKNGATVLPYNCLLNAQDANIGVQPNIFTKVVPLATFLPYNRAAYWVLHLSCAAWQLNHHCTQTPQEFSINIALQVTLSKPNAYLVASLYAYADWPAIMCYRDRTPKIKKSLLFVRLL